MTRPVYELKRLVCEPDARLRLEMLDHWISTNIEDLYQSSYITADAVKRGASEILALQDKHSWYEMAGALRGHGEQSEKTDPDTGNLITTRHVQVLHLGGDR